MSGAFQISSAIAPTKHGIYPLDFLVHLLTFWSLRKTLYFLRLYSTVKHAKKLRPPDRIIRAGKGLKIG
jgi:hypothetical protein